MTRRLSQTIRIAALIAALALARPGTAGPEEAAAPAPLASAKSIRALPEQEAAQARPVHLRGVVTFSDPATGTLFVHDGAAGIFVRPAPAGAGKPPGTGDQVEVTGVTDKGLFAPEVAGADGSGAEVRILGHGDVPEPRRVTGEELSRPANDSDWVEVEARVDEVRMHGADLVVACQVGGSYFDVVLGGPLPPSTVPWELTDSHVLIRGVAATGFNSNRQMTRRFLRISALSDIRPMEPGRAGAEEPGLVRADDLFRFGGPGSGDLVRLRGVVTFAMPGRGLYLRVPGGGIRVQTAQPIAAPPGSAVEVDGWPRTDAVKPFIRVRKITVLGVGVPPEPIKVAAKESLRSSLDADLVTVSGELLAVGRTAGGVSLELRDGGLVFRATIGEQAGKTLPDWEPGSRLGVTGIAQIGSSGIFIPQVVEDKLQILAGGPADVMVLSPPPYWTIRRVSNLAAGVVGLVVAGMGLVYVAAWLHRRNERQTQRREFDAVLAERGRFAREIHDSLAQGLTSVSLQLECVKDDLRRAPESAVAHLEMARGMVRESMREARRTIWNLRPLALGEADLASALQKFAVELTRGGKISCHQDIEGSPHPLKPDQEAALLRIGQEALTNAVRHAKASQIRLCLRFSREWVTLLVRDNGSGFDVAERVGKGFGLTGMHERVAALGGSLSIDSIPCEGTEVSATLPTHECPRQAPPRR